MNSLLPFIVLFASGPIIKAKLDTGLLLIIESSVQNNDFDILCALRESLIKINADGGHDIAIAYIDELHQCNPGIDETTTAGRESYGNNSNFEEGLFTN